jgi:hypothetical protein
MFCGFVGLMAKKGSPSNTFPFDKLIFCENAVMIIKNRKRVVVIFFIFE